MAKNTTKKQPNGYWNNYENNYNEAKKYNSRKEFQKGCQSAYNVARKNGWLDNYTWFEQKLKPSGYWVYETCFQEARKYNSRREFQKGCVSAYTVACKNGWLDNYTWFISTNELKKINQTKWTEQTCLQEAQKYNSRSEFQKSNGSAYDVARKNGWLDNYTWFISRNELQKLNQTKWTEQTCLQEARKYNSRFDFEKGCSGAYQVARKNSWLDNYTWFTEKKKYNYWTYETCYQEAKKYNSRSEFEKGCSGAYQVGYKNGWLDNYTWFTEKKKTNGYWENYENNYNEAQKYNSRSEFQKGSYGAYQVACKNSWLDNYTWFKEKKKYNYWTYETCFQEARKYNSRSEFEKGCSGACRVARQNGWLDNYTWFERDLNPYKNKRDNVYCYMYVELNSIYIGRTIDINKRNKQHNTDENSSVYKFAKQNNIPIPQITILETNLSLEQGREKEHFYVTKFKQDGWNVLNKARTGKNCGSLGGLGCGKWNKKTCYQEAKKYNSRSEFQKGCMSAYNVALKNGWLDNYNWFVEKQKPSGYWTEQTCYQEAQKYNSRSEFNKGCVSAYDVACKNGWLDNYTWFSVSKTSKKWTEQTCYQEALKYKSRIEFNKGCCGAYDVARKNGWLDNYTWFTEKKKTNGYWYNYENNYNEALKYKSRRKFQNGCKSAYNVALKNGWLDIFFPKAI